MKKTNNFTAGVISTLAGGILWGFSGTCSQYLFREYSIEPMLLTVIRMVFAGIILITVGFVKSKSNMLGIWKDKKDAGHLVLFAIAGLMFCQISYLKAIYYTNSGTATVISYIGPVLIMVFSCVTKKRLPSINEFAAIILAAAGTFVLATHGNIHAMNITANGLLWGLLSALGLALYTMIPTGIIRKWGAITVTGYGMIIGGIVLAVAGRVWTYTLKIDFTEIIFLAIIVVLGTVTAFTLYLNGVGKIGSVKASLLSCIEPVSATVFMVVWLHSDFTLIDALGFVLILSTVFILSLGKKKTEENNKSQ